MTQSVAVTGTVQTWPAGRWSGLVSAETSVTELASAVTQRLRARDTITLEVIGKDAAYVALKAIASAAGWLQQHDIALTVAVAWFTQDEQEGQLAMKGLRYTVWGTQP